MVHIKQTKAKCLVRNTLGPHFKDELEHDLVDARLSLCYLLKAQISLCVQTPGLQHPLLLSTTEQDCFNIPWTNRSDRGYIRGTRASSLTANDGMVFEGKKTLLALAQMVPV